MKKSFFCTALCLLILSGCEPDSFIPPAIEEPDKPEVPAEPEPEPEPDPVPYSIPVVRITTENSAPVVSKDDYVKGVIRVEDPSRHFSD